MATTTTRRARPVRTLVTLALLVAALFGALIAGVHFDPRSADNPAGAAWTPGLALDLEGGTQLILRPVSEDGQDVSAEAINQAISVIRQRIDSSGVAEAEITRQGTGNIVVGIPGAASKETIDLVKTSAQMRFRPVLAVAAPQPTASDEQSPAASPSPEVPASPEPSPSGEPSPSASSSTRPQNPSDLAQITPALQAEFDALDCTDPDNLVGGSSGPKDSAITACAQYDPTNPADAVGAAKYILGPVEIEGTNISSASSGLGVGANGVTTNEQVVNIKFDAKGTKQFAATTARLTQLTGVQNQFAIVLDGLVVSAPTTNSSIPNGQAEISGNFTRQSAATLANQLNFGALPLTFEVQSEEQISATLGTEQLRMGLMAGVVGLLLVVIYSMFQYRALGLVTVASLLLAALITYGVISLLSWWQGYRLSLPGVAGLIVAIGITADSFIVYFERIRDELRDGRSLPYAVDRGWDRARRTILASDTVSFLAAVVLYLLAVGGVRGFAFTLGLTTIVDLVIVFLFTHPIMLVLAKTRFFGEGHSASGLDPRRLGAQPRYAGRGRVTGRPDRGGETAPGGSSATGTAQVDGNGRRMTIAERRAAERAAQPAEPVEPDGSGQSTAAVDATDDEEGR